MRDTRKTWFLDFDGTLVEQRSYLADSDYVLKDTFRLFEELIMDDDFVVITTGREEHHRSRIESFMNKHGFRFDLIVCGLPTGPRIVVNDTKPDGTKTAYAFNATRDQGVSLEDMSASLHSS